MKMRSFLVELRKIESDEKWSLIEAEKVCRVT
jgi:hypothetical protein